ncbi:MULTISPECIES: two-component regulator propeller domain-containing protein [unclassified Myroides]|uniref:type IX secretion system anionic LPS delivery protein PorZ n=1 Tax=unclassified Myroides TaxID=2642485 RepID=UPI0015FDE3F1|nr:MULTISPECIES: two-component regulator propeller domain-containing protein [unclassified Myroides]MBB1149131.1 ABC transporter substrate-binding protein [Myroides sp. NP-2]MDM1406109.1 ABC transporter substrate-binding protein [Myroides sp. DF42-4-2]
MKIKGFICLLFLVVTSLRGQENTKWSSYFSYKELVALTQGRDVVFGATPSALLRYNVNSASVEVYNSVSGLKTSSITALYFSEVHQKLLVGSEDGSLLVFDLKSDRFRSILDIKNKPSLQQSERRINAFLEVKGEVYIGTNYGISVFNLSNNVFGDSYYIGQNGKNTAVRDVVATSKDLVAITAEGIKQVDLQHPNKVDYRQWTTWEPSPKWQRAYVRNEELFLSATEDPVLYQLTQPNQVREIATLEEPLVSFNKNEAGNLLVITPSSAYALHAGNQLVEVAQQHNLIDVVEVKGDYYLGSSYAGLVQLSKSGQRESLSPDGPESNRIFSLLATRAGTWFISGGYDKNTYNPYVPGLTARGLSYFNKKKGWEFISFDQLKDARALTYAALNPKNENELFVGSYHSGLLQIKLNPNTISTSEVSLWNHENTGTTGLENLEIDPEDPSFPPGYASVRVNGVVFDTQGKLWMTNNFVRRALKKREANDKWESYATTTGMFDYKRGNYGRLVIDKNNTKWIPSLEDGLVAFNETKNNRLASFNTDLGTLPSNNVSTLALDKNNQLWIGTNKGLRVIQNVNQFLQTTNLKPTNIVIEENGIAEELFYQQYITKIEVDGANKKWVAIADAGVFLVAPTGREIIHHFTKDNSPLPSNTINDIAVDPIAGEVFFATDLGVVSFMGDSSEGQESNSSFYAYPNPVRPEYLGEVRLVGLMDRSVVKITDIEGNLVFEATSNGGTVVWDTHAFNGKRVGSGVYLMMVSSADHNNTKVKKLMIIR